DLDVAGDRLEILVGQHYTSVAGAGRPAVGVRRRAVQPDAEAVAALAAVPLVGVIDGEGAGPVEVGELLARDTARDVIHPERRLLVAFAVLVAAVLADGRVVVGDIPQLAVAVLEDVERGLRRIYHECMMLLGGELYQEARDTVSRARLVVPGEPHPGFLA